MRAVRFGVGGFGVGVVRTSMKAPYKSLGRSPSAVCVYLASGALASHERGEHAFGEAYEPGDLVEVHLRPSAGKKGPAGSVDVVFKRNGEEVGIGAHSVANPEGLVLAVQPYMGGVALLQ